MKRFGNLIFGVACTLGLVACGGSATVSTDKLKTAATAGSGKKGKAVEVDKHAAASFDKALESFVQHDKKQDWNEATCTSLAQQFADAAKEQLASTGHVFPEVLYNSGLAFQRCGKETEAREKFEAASNADTSFHRARAQVILYEYARTGDTDSAISKLDTVIRDAKFQNVEALVSLAALQMERQSDQADAESKNDLERARLNLQRALAIDDSYMPALNQLALYYLEQAKAKAGLAEARKKGARRGMEVSGVKRADIDEQQLDLAALVASQGGRKNPNYAPIANTTGLIFVQLKNYNGAVKQFGRARHLDPKFFEAHMNYAAVNLSFRGFEEAEKSYREALKLRPKEYEAHLGLALALRGQINDSNFDKAVAEAQKSLDEAKKLEPQRAETYYNEAILTHEYRAKRGNAQPLLEKARQQYIEFTQKAGAETTFAAAVKRAKERAQDIDDTIKFLKEGEEADRQQKEIDAKLAAEAKEKAAADKAAAEKEAKEKAAADKAAADKAAADKAAADKAAKDAQKAPPAPVPGPAGKGAAPAPAGAAAPAPAGAAPGKAPPPAAPPAGGKPAPTPPAAAPPAGAKPAAPPAAAPAAPPAGAKPPETKPADPKKK